MSLLAHIEVAAIQPPPTIIILDVEGLLSKAACTCVCWENDEQWTNSRVELVQRAARLAVAWVLWTLLQPCYRKHHNNTSDRSNVSVSVFSCAMLHLEK